LERSNSTNASMSSSSENLGGVCAALTSKLASSLSYSPTPTYMVRNTQGYPCWRQSPPAPGTHNKPLQC
jgi:hypothetical protein